MEAATPDKRASWHGRPESEKKGIWIGKDDR